MGWTYFIDTSYFTRGPSDLCDLEKYPILAYQIYIQKSFIRKERKMKIQKITTSFFAILTAFFIIGNTLCFADDTKKLADKEPPYERHHYTDECSGMSHRMLRFSDKLSESNLKIFCSQFNDDQREKAMQLANQKDKNGNPIMTPDQAVEKVAKEGK